MIYFIIPAFNEAENLPELLSSLQGWAETRHRSCHLIVVDDGSTDGTNDILRDFDGIPISVVIHRPNRGVSAVFRSGFQAWRNLSGDANDLVVTLEADNTSSLAILDTMIERVWNGHDLVLASCYARGGAVIGTNLLRTTLSFCANLILRYTPGMPKVRTFSSFYRVYRGQFLARALSAYGDRMIEEEGFVCTAEMLLKFGLLGARISEVPLCLDGAKRKGASKMKVVHTIAGYLDLFARAATRRLARPPKMANVPAQIVAQDQATGVR